MSALRAILLSLSLLPLMTHADVLVIEHVQQSTGQDKPRNGLTMAEVESRYGAPREKRPAVGEPPITQWVYEGYVVYFEHERVIHAVTRRSTTP